MDSLKNEKVSGKKAGEEMHDCRNKYSNRQMCVSKDEWANEQNVAWIDACSNV